MRQDLLKGWFRALVIYAMLYELNWRFIPGLFRHFLDPTELELLSWNGYGAMIPVRVIFLVSALISTLYVVTGIGLLIWRKWARTAFSLLIAVHFLFMVFTGIAVVLWMESLWGYLCSMAEGAILAMAYLTGLADEFDPKPQED